MKRVILIMSLAILFCLNSNSQSISIRDFQLPITQAERLYFTGNLDYSGTDSMTTVADVNLYFEKFYSSLPYSYNIYANIFTDYGKSEIYDLFGNKEIIGSEGIYLTGSFDKYLKESSDIFLSCASQISYHMYSKNKNEDLRTNWSIGAGYGRVISATKMATAIRIQEYLLSEKLISGELDKDIVIEMASHCARLGEYAVKYGDKHPIDWYMDLEKILVKSGKLIDGRINPYALFRIQEVLNRERINYREIGWKITGYLTYSYNSTNLDYSDSYGTYLKLDFGYPLSNKLQFNHYTVYYFKIQYNTPNKPESNQITSNTTITYNLTNLLDFSLNYNMNLYSNNGYLNNIQDVSLNFYYYLENNIFLNLSAILRNQISRYVYSQYDNITYKSIKLNLGYRFF